MSFWHKPRRIGRHITAVNIRRVRRISAEVRPLVDATDPLTVGHPHRLNQKGARS